MKEIGRGLGVALWATLVLIAYDIARIPPGSLGRADAPAYLGEAVKLDLLTYAPLSFLILLPVIVALRALPAPLRLKLEMTKVRLPIDVGTVVAFATLAWGIAVLGERRALSQTGSAAWALDALLAGAGAVAAGWGAGLAVRRAVARDRAALRLGGLAILPLLPALVSMGPVASALSGTVEPPGVAPASAPDIILIVADTLRADALSCYARPTLPTPAIDSLAASGIRFAQATSQASWTNPSTATILTSRYPFEHGMVGFQGRIGPDSRTLAEALRARGYRTTGLVANLLVSRAYGFDRGFDDWDQEPDPRPLARHAHLLTWRLLRAMGVESSAVRTAGASDMVDRALHALSEETGRPRFLYLHFMDPHDPYTPPPDLARAADPGYTGKLTFTGGTLYSILRGEQPVSDADLRHARALYDAEVAGMDREIARLLERLKPRLLEGRAIVAFTADHGEEFMDHGALGHEHTLYQELIHVPLILSFHGILEAGRVVEDPVRLMDLAPTLLDLAGLPVEPSFHGRSLLPALRGAAPQASEPIFSEEDFTGYRTTSPRMRSARMGGVKVILYQRGIFDLGPWRSEAFDLSADGGERSPLREGDAASREAEAALRVWMSRQPGARTRGTEIDPETERRLRALGYIQ